LRSVYAFLVAASLAASLLAPGAALAQGSEKQAETLFTEGRAAMEKGDIETACKKFIESFDISGALGPLLNLAECEEKRGRPATALARWKRGLIKLQEKPKDKRIGPVQERITALEKVVPRLTVKLAPNAPEGTRVRIDGEIIEMPSGPVPVDPGERTVTVRAPDHEERKYKVAVVELDRKELTVTVGRKNSEIPPGGGGDTGGGSTGGGDTGGGDTGGGDTGGGQVGGGGQGGGEEGGGIQRTLGFASLGVGVAGLAAFAVTGGLMAAKQGEIKDLKCDPDKHTCQDSKDIPTANDYASTGATLGLVNTITLAAGAGFVVLGTILVVTSGGGKKTAPEPTAVGVAPLPGGAFMTLRTSF
jgi:hypothetical protein